MRWWHAGEEHVVTKYENRNLFEILLYVIFIASLWLLLPQKYLFIPVMFALTYVPYVIAERRIAIIFSPTEVIYRPAFRSPRRVKFEHIVEIRKTTVRRFVVGTFAGLEPGVAVRIVGGETIEWNLHLPHPDHILQELGRMAGKPIK